VWRAGTYFFFCWTGWIPTAWFYVCHCHPTSNYLSTSQLLMLCLVCQLAQRAFLRSPARNFLMRRELMAQLGIATNKITVTRLLEEVAKGNADDLSMKCFFLVIFNRLLFPGTGYDIANTDLQLIYRSRDTME
jgi:hypothetical protein